MKLQELFCSGNEVSNSATARQCMLVTCGIRKKKNSIWKEPARQCARGWSVGADEFSFVVNAVKESTKRVSH